MKATVEDYRVFTRAHDVVLDAAWLVTHPEFEPFAAAPSISTPDKSSLATEGDIAQTIIDAGNDYPDLSDVTITLLLDQSGSQRSLTRGDGVVAWVDRTVEALLHMDAEVEVLGFTTLRWKGGQSRRDWIEAGRPLNPGRLNDLLHIIYKEPNSPWRLSASGPSPRDCLYRLYREPYLREGIDGEAVEWAAGRLESRQRSTKILLTMSDCAPIDDSTLSMYPDPQILRAHLKTAVASAEAKGIAVVAIDNGGRSDHDPLYERIAYSADHRLFNGAEAAAAALRAVAEIANPQATPAP